MQFRESKTLVQSPVRSLDASKRCICFRNFDVIARHIRSWNLDPSARRIRSNNLGDTARYIGLSQVNSYVRCIVCSLFGVLVSSSGPRTFDVVWTFDLRPFQAIPLEPKTPAVSSAEKGGPWVPIFLLHCSGLGFAMFAVLLEACA